MKHTLIPCEANDHVVGLATVEDEELFYLDIYIGGFYSGQESFFSRWWKRLCIIATIARGREYLFEEVVISRENASKLAEALNATPQSQ